MRLTLICLAALLVAFVGYAYDRDPAGCQKVVDDVVALVRNVSPIPLQPDAASQASAPSQEKTNSANVSPKAPAPAAPPVVTAPVPAAAPTISAPSPPPPPTWAPPAVMPAQPNWTWTTSDGKTYQNVVVTEIEPETVSITHSLGASHIPINLLPPDIQKQLNYDPAAVAAARAETERETAHPYYTLASVADAQTVAQQMHWPLAWLVSGPALLSAVNPPADSFAELTHMAMDHLKSRSIIIFVDGYTELMAVPPIIRDQLFHLDDGALAEGHHLNPPKIVFSSSDITKTFGRVSSTQMKASREAAIDAVLATIPKDPDAPSPSPRPTAPAAPAPPSTSATPSSPDAIKPWAPPDVMPAQSNWTWTTSDGTTYQNVVVTKIGPAMVSITHSLGAAHILISTLPPEIQKQLNYDPRAASQITALIDGKLISADGTAADAPGPSVQYYALYYSAQWCPPCHAFTPHLVKWYNAFKPSHPNFELIFVSEDRDEAAMLSYMKEMAMPWLAVRFGDLKHDGGFKGSGIEMFADKGIPDLVLVDSGGKVLSDSYQGGTYVGPEAVVDDINRLVGSGSPTPFVRQTPSAPSGRSLVLF